MLISYQRRGGMQPPPDNETLTIEDDGSFSLWRSISWAVYPPTPVGRFAGKLSAAMLERLKQASAAASQSGNIHLISRPGNAIQTIELGKVRGEVSANDDAPGAWGTLITLLSDLARDLTAHPVAAIALEVADEGKSARLVHRGKQPLKLDLTGMTLHADLFRPKTYETVKGWNARKMATPGIVTVAAGWTFDLSFDHNFKIATGLVVQAKAEFTIFDGDQAVPVSVESAP
ncbi:MAG: hypothetical protein ACYDBJ_17765 [Aggregatilineales bacterium]